MRRVKWLDRYWDRLFAKPASFGCGWCSRDGDFGRHDMCTGSAVRPHREGTLRPAAVTECACALREHKGAVRANAPEATTFPTVADPWAAPQPSAARQEHVESAVDSGSDPHRYVPHRPVDTPQARRRRLTRRRRLATVRNVLPAIAIVLALAFISRCGGGNEGGTPRTAFGPTAGEPAVWRVDPAQPPRTQARSFTALVSRLGCGEVEDVLAPQVIENPVSVIVIFRAAPATADDMDGCAMAAPVPYSVRLATPLGDRTLFDGTCDVPPARSAPECVTAQRWPMME